MYILGLSSRNEHRPNNTTTRANTMSSTLNIYSVRPTGPAPECTSFVGGLSFSTSVLCLQQRQPFSHNLSSLNKNHLNNLLTPNFHWYLQLHLNVQYLTLLLEAHILLGTAINALNTSPGSLHHISPPGCPAATVITIRKLPKLLCPRTLDHVATNNYATSDLTDSLSQELARCSHPL